MHALVRVEVQEVYHGKEIIYVMMKTIIVDVNGMEETVVVVMLTQLIVQFVNVWTQMNQDQERNKSY